MIRPWADRRGRWLLVAALVVIAVGSVAAWRYYSARESTDDAQIDGTIVSIAPRVGGMVTAVHVSENQHVESGDVLVEIDPQNYRIAVDKAEAELQAAQGALEGARAGVPLTSRTTASSLSTAEAQLASSRAAHRSTEQEIAAARARLDAARVRSKQAEDDLARMKLLVAKQEISQQQYDAAQSQATADEAAASEAEQQVAIAESHEGQAASAVTSAEAAVEKAKAGPAEVTVSKSQRSSAEARLDLARAKLDQAKLDLERTKITAPIAGVISKKSVEVGEIVRAEQPLMALVSLDEVWVIANFKETQLHHMRAGLAASVSVDAYGKIYRGHVDSIAPATGARFSLLPPENASGNFVKVVQRVPVKIVLDAGQDAGHRLRPGMSVEATVFTH